MKNKTANYNKTIKRINFLNVFIPLFCLSAPAAIILTLHHFGLIDRFLEPAIFFIFMIVISAYYLKWHLYNHIEIEEIPEPNNIQEEENRYEEK